MNHRLTLLVVLVLVFAVGCGSNGKTTPTPTPPPSVSVSISPGSSAILVNQATAFTATVGGTSNTAVTWTVREQAGGTVAGGDYHAPWANGTYHVVATSVADPTKSASATVSVSAKFAFLEQTLCGVAAPWSVTTIIGTLGADGAFSTVDNLSDTSIYSVYLSQDGKKVVYDMPSSGTGATLTADGVRPSLACGDAQRPITLPNAITTSAIKNIYVANPDWSGSSELTSNLPGDDVYDWLAEFSPDLQSIVYAHEVENLGTNELWAMNADGSNRHLLLGAPYIAVYPSFSADGSKIVAEVEQDINSQTYDGIAVMNSDGTNVVQLTGLYDPLCDGWDEMPTFTNDGQHIAFSRWCAATNAEAVYIMNLDGSSITNLHGDNATYVSCQPRAVGDKLVFSTNVDHPGTHTFQMYSIMPDGSSLTRLTGSSMYDGFSVVWLGTHDASAQSNSVSIFQKRIEHRKRLHERLGIR